MSKDLKMSSTCDEVERVQGPLRWPTGANT